MISKTILVIQINLFVKWMTQNTLSFGIYGDDSKIATYGHCTVWMLYRYTIKQFYSFLEKMNCIKLYCIYFKSMCFVTIICITIKIIFDICFKIWTI